MLDIDPAGDPPRLLVVGPDRAGNLIEVVVLELPNHRLLAIHAMPMRKHYESLLAKGEDA